MKTAVIYYSIYGSTKEYAEWIANETGAKLYSFDEVPEETLEDFDTVIFGSPVMMGTITMKIGSVITRNWDVLREKRLGFFSVSGKGIKSKSALDAWEHSLPAEYRRDFAYFMFGGRLKIKDLKFFHKLISKMVNAEETDFVDKGQIKSLVKFIKTGKR